VVVVVPTIQEEAVVDIALLLVTHRQPLAHKQFQVQWVVAVPQVTAVAEQDLRQREEAQH
jgi:hypothetical protein